MIRAVAAAGLALVAVGCSSGEPAPFVAEPPPTVAPVVEPTTAPPAQALPTTRGPAPVAQVPLRALLDPADLGPGWGRATGETLGCASGLPARPSRSTTLRDGRGTVTETVSTGVEVPTAVSAWRRALTRCGWVVSDFELGDAGLSAVTRDRSGRVVVTGTEGVVVVLHATRGLARATEEMDGWADLALGTSCEAAPDGCH